MKVIGVMAGVAGARLGARAGARRARGRPGRLAARVPREPAGRPRRARCSAGGCRRPPPGSLAASPGPARRRCSRSRPSGRSRSARSRAPCGAGAIRARSPRSRLGACSTPLLRLALRAASGAGARARRCSACARSAPGNLGRAAAGDELLRARARQLAVPHAGLGLLRAARRPRDRARAAGERRRGVRGRALHRPRRPAAVRAAGRADQRGRGRLARDAGRAGARVRGASGCRRRC